MYVSQDKGAFGVQQTGDKLKKRLGIAPLETEGPSQDNRGNSRSGGPFQPGSPFWESSPEVPAPPARRRLFGPRRRRVKRETALSTTPFCLSSLCPLLDPRPGRYPFQKAVFWRPGAPRLAPAGSETHEELRGASAWPRAGGGWSPLPRGQLMSRGRGAAFTAPAGLRAVCNCVFLP